MNCKNCNKTLNDNQNYCDECGAKVIRNRLTPQVLANQVNEQFLSIDNLFLRTFLSLCIKPGEVIIDYINGTRKKYMNVLQYFAVSLTLAGIQVFLLTTFFKEALVIEPELMKDIKSMPGQENNPFFNSSFEGFSQYQSIIYILGVPISAIASWFIYYMLGTRCYNFTEHLVLNLYYSAQVIIITSALSILFLAFGNNYLLLSSLIIFPTFIYLGFVLKDVFKESHLETFAKFILIMIVYGILYIILMLFIVIFMILKEKNII